MSSSYLITSQRPFLQISSLWGWLVVRASTYELERDAVKFIAVSQRKKYR